MKIGILSNEAHTNAQKNSVGSSRIRVSWVLKHWPDAEEFKIGVKYDAIIFQKAYFTEYMKVYEGIKILDLCDPDWMEGRPVVECIELCDAVAVSSQGLFDYLKKITTKPVYFIPDRIDPDSHTERKEHEGRAKAIVWFGYHTNQVILDAVLPALKRLGLDLTVISDLPYHPGSAIEGIDKGWVDGHVRNIKFDPESLNQEIIHGGDIVLNYRPEYGKFVFKSDNKTIIAWAIGMPVARSVDELERFMDAEERKKESEARLAEVAEKWTSDKSVAEYKHAISSAEVARAFRPESVS